MQRDREGIRKMERLVLQKSYLFLTPLIVATAPLCLPYCSATPRNTTGNGRGEGGTQFIAFAKIHAYPRCFL